MTQINLTLLLVRVVIGLTLAAHGANKIKGGLDGTGRWFESMGMKPGWLHARLAAFTEVGAGLAMVVGFLVPLAGAGFVSLMLVAGITAHRGKGFFIFRPGEGWEYVLVLGTIGAAMGGLGGGKYSIDHRLEWGFNNKGLAISLIVGLGGGIGLLAGFWRPPPKA